MMHQPAASGGPDEQWVRVREILDQALRLPPGERPAYLDRACGADTSLRAEVESLLEAAARSAFFDQPALTATMTLSQDTGDELEPGRKVSHYEVVGKVAEGGMGAVYRAIDTNLGRPVALKVISRAFISTDDKRRFAREAKAASALNHPNIVTIYEYNSEAGLDFIAMEFVEGVPLDKLLRQRGTPLPVLFDYARQVASALAKAHALGIVHRDLKPGNIMITTDGVAKVLDFGLAKQETADPDQGTATALTRVGMVMGTPAYMSPEQAMGEAVDYRSDIFSFGVILYEMVSGRRPFQGENAQATLRQILYKEPTPLGDTAPGAASDLISKCLRKKREERLASMTDAVALLSPPHVAPAVSPRRRTRNAAVVAVVAMVLGAAGSLLSPGVRHRILPARAAVASPATADSLNGTASELTTRARGLLRRYDRSGYLDRSIRLLETALERDRQFAPAYAALAEAYLRKGHSVTSADNHWLKLARDSASQAVSANPDLAEAHTSLGDVLLEAGEAAPAKTEIERALQLDPLSSAACLALARLNAKSDPARAETLYRKAAKLAPDDWIPHSEYGLFLYRAARYREAAAEWQEATRVTPDNVFMWRNLGAAYHMLNEFDKSESALQKALEIEPTAAVWNNLGTARFFQGHYTESVAAFEKAVALNPTNYLNWGNLGDAYRWAPGQRNKAAGAYARAISLVRDLLSRDAKNSELRGRLALYLAKSGQTGAAEAELKNLAATPKLPPADEFKVALTEEVLGRRDAALAALGKAIRGGYSLREVENEPELTALRSDVRYYSLISQAPAPK